MCFQGLASSTNCVEEKSIEAGGEVNGNAAGCPLAFSLFLCPLDCLERIQTRHAEQSGETLPSGDVENAQR